MSIQINRAASCGIGCFATWRKMELIVAYRPNFSPRFHLTSHLISHLISYLISHSFLTMHAHRHVRLG
jgi:hypothetical protein